MAETVSGGVYEDAPGAGTYHDANGKPVSKEALAQHLELVAGRNKKAQELADEAVRQQAAQLVGVRQLLGVTQQAVAAPRTAVPPTPVAESTPTKRS